MKLVTDVMKDQFHHMKSDLSSEAERNLDLMKRKMVQTDENVVFRYEGNKKQYDFNSKARNAVLETKFSLETSTIEDIGDSLENVVKLIEHRNKLIKIADRSDGGWNTVQEYEKGDIAENSDDERKIRQADTRAVQKRKKFLQRREPASGSMPHTAPRFFRGPTSIAKSSDTCWKCGGYGHHRRECIVVMPPGMQPLPAGFTPPAAYPPLFPPSQWGRPATKIPEAQGGQRPRP
ncbi:MAG: hypothetical protein ABW185_04660 [Sedimenticola sp.]